MIPHERPKIDASQDGHAPGLDWWALTVALIGLVSLLVLVGLLASRGLL